MEISIKVMRREFMFVRTNNMSYALVYYYSKCVGYLTIITFYIEKFCKTFFNLEFFEFIKYQLGCGNFLKISSCVREGYKLNYYLLIFQIYGMCFLRIENWQWKCLFENENFSSKMRISLQKWVFSFENENLMCTFQQFGQLLCSHVTLIMKIMGLYEKKSNNYLWSQSRWNSMNLVAVNRHYCVVEWKKAASWADVLNKTANDVSWRLRAISASCELEWWWWLFIMNVICRH